VTISRSFTVSEILALISQNSKRSRDPKCTPVLQNFNMCNGSRPTLYVQSTNQIWKCLASFALIWPGPQNVEMGHVTLTTPTWGDQLETRKLILHIVNPYTKFEFFSRPSMPIQGMQNFKIRHVTLTTPLSGLMHYRQVGDQNWSPYLHPLRRYEKRCNMYKLG